MAFETVFASEIPLSAIKSTICRRFSSFRFWFSVFIVVLSDSSTFIEACSSNTKCICFFRPLSVTIPQTHLPRKRFISVYSFYQYFSLSLHSHSIALHNATNHSRHIRKWHFEALARSAGNLIGWPHHAQEYHLGDWYVCYQIWCTYLFKKTKSLMNIILNTDKNTIHN